jgi:hypothetical protein
MTSNAILTRFEELNTCRQGDQRAPHKPMRHKKLSLSLVMYNDPCMADARKVLDALPKLT